MDLRLSVDQAVEISGAFAAAPAIVLDELEKTMVDLMGNLERETKEGTPNDSATLEKAFILDVRSDVDVDMVIGTLSNPLAYALPVELGTKPHFPPFKPILSWVERKLGLSGDEAENRAYAIQHKIGRYGSQGKFMARNALLNQRESIAVGFADCAGRITARIAAEGQA